MISSRGYTILLINVYYNITKMKKTLVVLIAFLLVSSAAFSQDNLGWKFSVNFNPLISWTPASGRIESNGSRLGFDFALHAEHYFKQRYAYFAGVSLLNIGGRVQNTTSNILNFRTTNFGLNPGQEARLRMQYITVPIGLKFKTPDYGLLAYYFQAALLPGIRVGASGSTSDRPSESLSSDFNLMTIGMQLGVGCMYATGDDTYLKLGVVFNNLFVDALRDSKMKAVPVNLGLNIGFLF